MYIKTKKELDFIKINNKVDRVFSSGNAKYGIDIIITPHKEKRSLEQNNYYFLICSDISNFFNDAGIVFKKAKFNGIEYPIYWSSNAIHLFNKTIFGINTTTRLTKKEFCEFMEKVFELWIEKSLEYTKGLKSWEPPLPLYKMEF